MTGGERYEVGEPLQSYGIAVSNIPADGVREREEGDGIGHMVVPPLSKVEERGLARTLEYDVEPVKRWDGARLRAGKQSLPARLRNQKEHRIGKVGGLIRKIEPGHKMVEEPSRMNYDADVRRLQTWRRVLIKGDGARLDGLKPEEARLVGTRASIPDEASIR
jgi:hypothetical protein